MLHVKYKTQRFDRSDQLRYLRVIFRNDSPFSIPIFIIRASKGQSSNFYRLNKKSQILDGIRSSCCRITFNEFFRAAGSTIDGVRGDPSEGKNNRLEKRLKPIGGPNKKARTGSALESEPCSESLREFICPWSSVARLRVVRATIHARPHARRAYLRV